MIKKESEKSFVAFILGQTQNAPERTKTFGQFYLNPGSSFISVASECK
jgi:hypothetical protein